SPSSSSTPPATPTPKPTATPPTGGGVGSLTCKLGKGSTDTDCARGTPQLMDAIHAAEDATVKQKPQAFDTSQEVIPGSGQYLVVDEDAYLNGVVSNLIGAGYCAQRDPDDADYQRIQIKNSNSFSETYDVLSGTNYIRRGGYLNTCTPASFPVDRGDAPPAGSGCGLPYPPPVYRMTCKVHLFLRDYYALDSTALVGHDVFYCAEIGYTDGRSLCPARLDGSPERGPCENWRVGNAKDTGEPGPTWTLDGHYCTGQASGCEHDPSNPYALLAYASGTYTVCAQTGDCCQVDVQR
ncbi:MAG TPA: hypothetical protein VL691_18985, partial [Vicinamibacteria bacterium]|nr:hypothetical protein [Vicinamibacteria bacterium]